MRFIQTFVIVWLITTGAEKVAFSSDFHKSELYIFATKHLYALKNEAPLTVLNHTLKSLEAFNPGLIAIEKMPPQQIHAMLETEGKSQDVAKQYNKFQIDAGVQAQKKLRVTFNQAYAQVSNLHQGCQQGVAVDRCIVTFAAAYDGYTALLLWTDLNKDAQQKFKLAYPQIAESFEKMMTSSNEIISIALKLAKQLGHKRLYPVDNHSEKPRLLDYIETLEGEKNPFALLGDVKEHPFLKELKEKYEQARDAGDLYPYYKWVNQSSTGEKDEDFQWHAMLRNEIDNGIGHSMVASWEARNLRQAANISEVMRENPGKSLLYIVGSGHKPILDRYFRASLWAKPVEANRIFKD